MKTFITLFFTTIMLHTMAQEIPMFVGTYTDKGSQGIYYYMFDTQSGTATLSASTAAVDPSFLARSKNGKVLYAVKERNDKEAALSAFAFDGDALSLLNTLPTEGGAPCHIAIAKKYPIALVANYGGGSLSVFRLEENGALGELIQVIQEKGSGPDRDRQEASHVHSAFFSGDEKHVYVQNLGTDKITMYRLEKTKDTYKLVEEGHVDAPAGGGPRHLLFDAKEKNMYVLLEMRAEIAHYVREGKSWKFVEATSINEAGFSGQNGAAEIKFSPDYKFIYASNRGDANSVALLNVEKSGKLALVQVYPSGGRGPRNFNISPDGRFLLVANQATDTIQIFKRDLATGTLTDTEKPIEVSTPVCIVF